MNILSLVIPTYNNQYSLLKCIKEAARSFEELNINYEIIIVDNYLKNDHLFDRALIDQKHIRIIRNYIVGAHFSRKLGLYNSIGNIILFLDDDNYITVSYLKFIIQKSETVGDFFIGCATKEYNFINWGKLKYNSYSYACGSLLGYEFYKGIPVYWGAGHCISRDLALKIYEKDLIVEGRLNKRNYIMSGEDHEISIRAFLLTKNLFYFSEIGLYHDFEASRLNDIYYNKLQIGFSLASWILKIYYLKISGSVFTNHWLTFYVFNLSKASLYLIKHPLKLEARLILINSLPPYSIKLRYNTIKGYVV